MEMALKRNAKSLKNCLGSSGNHRETVRIVVHMIKRFWIAEEIDVRVMENIVNEMRGLLEKLVSGEIPNDGTYTRTDLKEFCTSLINGQRNDMRIMKSGSWCVAPATTNMPGDARVYLALSNPDFCPELLQILRDIKEDLADALQRGVTEGPWGEDYIKALTFVEDC